MTQSKLKHTRLYEQVISNIEQQYQEGKLKLGDKLPTEREMAVLFDISRGTLRDAFRVLESQGIIETRPGGGRYLRKSLKSDAVKGESIIEDLQNVAILDLLEAREILEVGLMDLICMRAKDKEIEQIRQLILNSDESDLDGKGLDNYFHQALAELSENIVITKYLMMNIELINQTRSKSFKDQSNYQEAKEEHLAILDAIIQRDTEMAKKRMKKHFARIRKRLELDSDK